jgi:hypothetical protein
MLARVCGKGLVFGRDEIAVLLMALKRLINGYRSFSVASNMAPVRELRRKRSGRLVHDGEERRIGLVGWTRQYSRVNENRATE